MASRNIMKFKIFDYEKPNKNDICVAMCFFRPINYYKNIVRNLHIVLEDLKKASIPFYIIELLYKNQESCICNPTKIVRSNSVVFSKENLWNIIEKEIPEKYSKIIFLDTDIRFNNENWVDLASECLDEHKLIQPMEFIYREQSNFNIKSNLYFIKQSDLRQSSAKAINKKEKLENFRYYYPGFSICIDRNFYHEIGGITEHSVTGTGDCIFWSCFFKDEENYIDNFYKYSTNQEGFIEYYKNIKNIINNKENIVGYVKNTIAVHLYHGPENKRIYNSLSKYMPDNYKLFKNDYGVIEIQGNKDLTDYWINRNEDE